MRSYVAKLVNRLHNMKKSTVIIFSVAAIVLIAAVILIPLYFTGGEGAAAPHETADRDVGMNVTPSQGGTDAPETPDAVPTPETHEDSSYIMTKIKYDNGEEFKCEYSDDSFTLRNSDGMIEYYAVFDADGHKTEVYSDSTHVKYVYSAGGRLEKELHYSVAPEGAESLQGLSYDTYRYNYNDKGLLESVDMSSDEAADPYRTIRYEYDGDGNILKITQIMNADPYSYTVNTYDGGLLRSSAVYTVYNDRLTEKYDYIYDEDGNLVRTDSVTSPATANRYVNGYELYDKAGRLTERYSDYYIGSFNDDYLFSLYVDTDGEALLSDMNSIFDNGCERHTYSPDTENIIQIEDIVCDSSEAAVWPCSIWYDNGEDVYKILFPFSYSEYEIGKYRETHYDAQGNETSVSYYDVKTDPIYTKSTEYDTQGRKIYEEHAYKDYITVQTRYAYDENGALSKTALTYTASLQSQNIDYYFKDGRLNRYTVNGNLNAIYEYSSSGDIQSKILSYQDETSEYAVSVYIGFSDDGGRHVNAVTVNDKTFEFDLNRHIIKESVRNSSSDVTEVNEYSYDSSDRLVKYTVSDGKDNLLKEVFYTYNGNDKETERVITYGDGKSVLSDMTFIVIEPGADNKGETYEDGVLTGLYGIDSFGNAFTAEFDWVPYENGEADKTVYSRIDADRLIP